MGEIETIEVIGILITLFTLCAPCFALGFILGMFVRRR